MSVNNRILEAGNVSALNFGSSPAFVKACSAKSPLLKKY